MKNISKIVQVFFLLVGFSMFYSGCSTHIPVKKEVGTLNLQNKEFKKEKPLSEVIAIVSPVFAKHDATVQAQHQLSRYELIMQKRRELTQGYNFEAEFAKSYADRLSRAFESSISEIISSKGFKLKGPYASFDDMTYGEKKKIYLAFVPKIDFQIENKVLSKEQNRLYFHQEGVIQIGGSFVITMLEPMTGEVFLKKRINLSDFNIEEPYVYEKQYRTGTGGLTGAAMDKASAPDHLVDTTDVALTKAINKFYEKAIEKINLYLDRDEILSYKKDILKLKGLKRF